MHLPGEYVLGVSVNPQEPARRVTVNRHGEILSQLLDPRLSQARFSPGAGRNVVRGHHDRKNQYDLAAGGDYSLFCGPHGDRLVLQATGEQGGTARSGQSADTRVTVKGYHNLRSPLTVELAGLKVETITLSLADNDLIMHIDETGARYQLRFSDFILCHATKGYGYIQLQDSTGEHYQLATDGENAWLYQGALLRDAEARLRKDAQGRLQASGTGITLYAQTAPVVVMGASEASEISYAGSSQLRLWGQAQQDTLTGGNGENWMEAGGGDDYMVAGDAGSTNLIHIGKNEGDDVFLAEEKSHNLVIFRKGSEAKEIFLQKTAEEDFPALLLQFKALEKQSSVHGTNHGSLKLCVFNAQGELAGSTWLKAGDRLLSLRRLMMTPAVIPVPGELRSLADILDILWTENSHRLSTRLADTLALMQALRTGQIDGETLSREQYLLLQEITLQDEEVPMALAQRVAGSAAAWVRYKKALESLLMLGEETLHSLNGLTIAEILAFSATGSSLRHAGRAAWRDTFAASDRPVSATEALVPEQVPDDEKRLMSLNGLSLEEAQKKVAQWGAVQTDDVSEQELSGTGMHEQRAAGSDSGNLILTRQALYVAEQFAGINGNARVRSLVWLQNQLGMREAPALMKALKICVLLNKKKVLSGIATREQILLARLQQTLAPVLNDDLPVRQMMTLRQLLQSPPAGKVTAYQLTLGRKTLALSISKENAVLSAGLYDADLHTSYSLTGRHYQHPFAFFKEIHNLVSDYLNQKPAGWGDKTLAELYGVQHHDDSLLVGVRNLELGFLSHTVQTPDIQELLSLSENFVSERQRMQGQAGEAALTVLGMTLRRRDWYALGALDEKGNRIGVETEAHNIHLPALNAGTIAEWLYHNTHPDTLQKMENLLQSTELAEKAQRMYEREARLTASPVPLPELADRQFSWFVTHVAPQQLTSDYGEAKVRAFVARLAEAVTTQAVTEDTLQMLHVRQRDTASGKQNETMALFEAMVSFPDSTGPTSVQAPLSGSAGLGELTSTISSQATFLPLSLQRM